jgi:hypothetical protein
LLKALQVTHNPQELRRLTGLRTVAEVYRTLDKLALRKEYHEALVRQGIDFDTIVSGIKEVCDQADGTPGGLSVKLKGYQTLMKSLGVSEYKENVEGGGKGWEDILVDMDNGKTLLPGERPKYEVIEPSKPQGEIDAENAEEELANSLYE